VVSGPVSECTALLLLFTVPNVLWLYIILCKFLYFMWELVSFYFENRDSAAFMYFCQLFHIFLIYFLRPEIFSAKVF
jgi:hypothetical protein